MQVFFVAFSATCALTYIYERGGSERFIRRHCGGDNALYFMKNSQIRDAISNERSSVYEGDGEVYPGSGDADARRRDPACKRA